MFLLSLNGSKQLVLQLICRSRGLFVDAGCKVTQFMDSTCVFCALATYSLPMPTRVELNIDIPGSRMGRRQA